MPLYTLTSLHNLRLDSRTMKEPWAHKVILPIGETAFRAQATTKVYGHYGR